MTTLAALALNTGLAAAVLAPTYVRHVVLPWHRARKGRAA